ncbi:Mitochondrial import inner membrane translocase subunit tim10 [Smittium culicis]|uniref:Mitochondrial import inner membrane translocase subunit n=1 Tax=Smittium culicis TaxID=133412 RepID=A0A1R1YHT1_9FUNG|nr:Mitochondrial import inner membrane translocase subunit tim10 [Smittium culicis]
MFGGFTGGNNNQAAAAPQPAAGFSGANPQYYQQNQQSQLAAAEQEMDMISDLFNRLSDACHKKCIINKYPDGDLTKGESVCIDRCVSKFFQVNKEVGDVLAKLSEMNQNR